MTGQGTATGGSGSGYSGAPHRSYEERAAHREQVMNNIRETSQQDRRVYVGNLSYDVKWHHLKDFMRQGGFSGGGQSGLRCFGRGTNAANHSRRGSLCRCAASSQWNVEGGRLQVIWLVLLWFLSLGF